MRKLFLIISLFTLTVTQSTSEQHYTKSNTPEPIIINLSATPAESMAVTWRTIDGIDNAVVQIAEATDWIEFEKDVRFINPIQLIVTETMSEREKRFFQ